MAKFFGKISAGVGNGVELATLDSLVSKLMATCDSDLAKAADAEQLTVSQATQFEKDLFAKLLAQYDKKAASVTGKPVSPNWNDRGEDAPKANSAVRKRKLYRELEKRSGTLHPMFLASKEATIKAVLDAFKEAKAETVVYYTQVQETLPMQSELLIALITRKHDESIEKALQDAGGMENIDKVARLTGDKEVTMATLHASLLKCETETRQQNDLLILQAKNVEMKNIENAIGEAIKKALKELVLQQERKHFAESEFPFLSAAEKVQFEQQLVGKICEKQKSLGCI